MVSAATKPSLRGRYRTPSLIALAVAWGLFVSAFGVARGLAADGALTEPFEEPAVLAVTVVALGALAGAAAYRNAGFVPSWSLVFGPALGWFPHFFAGGGAIPEAIAFGFGVALVFSVVLGTAGYATGRVARDLRVGDPAGAPGGAMGLVIGRERARAKRWLRVGAGLAVAAFGVVGLSHPFGPEGAGLVAGFFYVAPLVGRETLLAAAVVLVWIGLAAWPAVRRDGLLASWGLVFGPAFGGTANYFVTDGFSGDGPFVDAVLAALVALLLALALGSPGYLAGTAIRRLGLADRSG